MPAPKGNKNAVGAASGRPTKYTSNMVEKTRKYIASCKDTVEEFHKTRGEKSDSYDRILKVNLPLMASLALTLKVNKSTLYEWAKKNEEFSDVLDELHAEQEKRLLLHGLTGDYNPLITKLILSARHDYKEKTDVTSGDKPLTLSFDPTFKDER